eukprot:TRINITY_DN11935_c0_g1_i4.p1 TRINITY_DN11935_c0_g1~~TRINITY_DN11935_c0_g1_i4.p1  ORF type:complete len:425 (-),score=72.01 TRINITY_DN11935_c0_g1_i4:387-1661(-)
MGVSYYRTSSSTRQFLYDNWGALQDLNICFGTGFSFGVLGVGVILGSAIFPFGLLITIPASIGVGLLLYANHARVEGLIGSYDAVLSFLIACTKHWSVLSPNGSTTTRESTPAPARPQFASDPRAVINNPQAFPGDVPGRAQAMERVLAKEYLQLERDGWDLSMASLPGNLDFFISEPSTLLKDALQRSRAIAELVSLEDYTLSNNFFVGILGKEDVGKATLIKKLMAKLGLTDGLPKSGVSIHTKYVQPFKATENLYLVDFPGIDTTQPHGAMALWNKFCAVPDLAVLMFQYENDLKDSQLKMYNEVVEALKNKEDIIVVFNKAEQGLPDVDDDDVECVNYGKLFAIQRSAVADKFRCSEENIFFTSLTKPSRLAGPNGEDLRQYGVLGIAGLAAVLKRKVVEHSTGELAKKLEAGLAKFVDE